MKRILVPMIAVVLAVACNNEKPAPENAEATRPTVAKTPPRPDRAFHSPNQALDRTVLSTIPSGKRDFRRDPPRVESVDAQVLEGGRVRLSVRFAEKDLPRVIQLQDEKETVTLRDDGAEGDTAGDGIFTGTAAIAPEFLRERAAVARRFAASREMSVFRNRQLVRLQKPVLEFRPDRFRIPDVFDFPPPPPPPAIDPARSLLINAPTVVGDPKRAGNPCVAGSNALGPWSFGSLMTEMANQSATGITPSQLVQRWLEEWALDQTVNGPDVPARTNINNVITAWKNASGGGALDMKKAPFRLIAIVNRIDLADNPSYGGNANSGELRFVFGLMNNCQPTRFAVIFEYGVPPKSCFGLKAYAQQWRNLSNLAVGSAAYNAALQAITDPITVHGAGGSKPNGSALNQLRSNENFLNPLWELREFRINAASRLLEQTTTKQTPITSFNNQASLRDFINNNQASILNGTYVVDLLLNGAPFLSGSAPMPPGVWNGAAVVNNNDARNKFSLGTCSGCHFTETKTPFVHINPASPIGSPAALSGFLTGINMNDPVVAATPRSYHDLQDRKNRIDAIQGSPCFILGLFNQPRRMVH
ncbi:MAG TPA: hypothetical protein VM733_02515 [Thermoanaerobaculia bacterium]|nr:hypothetical protein [Thermoanaerobaculia bacterium]